MKKEWEKLAVMPTLYSEGYVNWYAGAHSIYVLRRWEDGVWLVRCRFQTCELPGVTTADEAKAVAGTMYRMGEL